MGSQSKSKININGYCYTFHVNNKHGERWRCASNRRCKAFLYLDDEGVPRLNGTTMIHNHPSKKNFTAKATENTSIYAARLSQLNTKKSVDNLFPNGVNVFGQIAQCRENIKMKQEALRARQGNFNNTIMEISEPFVDSFGQVAESSILDTAAVSVLLKNSYLCSNFQSTVEPADISVKYNTDKDDHIQKKCGINALQDSATHTNCIDNCIKPTEHDNENTKGYDNPDKKFSIYKHQDSVTPSTSTNNCIEHSEQDNDENSEKYDDNDEDDDDEYGDDDDDSDQEEMDDDEEINYEEDSSNEGSEDDDSKDFRKKPERKPYASSKKNPAILNEILSESHFNSIPPVMLEIYNCKLKRMYSNWTDPNFLVEDLKSLLKKRTPDGDFSKDLEIRFIVKELQKAKIIY